MLSGLQSAFKSIASWLVEFWAVWRGAIVLAVIVLAIGSVAWCYADDIVDKISGDKSSGKIAITVVVLFAAFGLSLLVTFFWLFRGIRANEEKLTSIITYCYAFIVFSLSASVLPFLVLPLIPALGDIMIRSPIGIVAGCSLPILGGEDKSVPRELRCGVNSEQWVVNIGGTAAAMPKVNASTQEVPKGANAPEAPGDSIAISKGRSATDSELKNDPEALPGVARQVAIKGGLVVPLYAVVLSLMGAAVSMTRRVPEFQRRLSPGDPEYLTYDQAREGLVFQIMQVASAPLIVLTAYYVVDPGSRATTIVLSFASGFSSETVLLMIRALLEKLRPAAPTPAAKATGFLIAPARLDFGSVPKNTSVRKSLVITNASPTALDISAVTCTGEFAAVTLAPMKIDSGAHGAIEVEFKPASLGPKQGLLTITDSAAGGTRAIDLTGTGI